MRERIAVAAMAVSIALGGQLVAQEAFARDGSSAPFAFGVTVGTLGLGAEASILATSNVVLRVNGSFYGLDLSEDASKSSSTVSSEYKFNADAVFAGAIVDWHPFSGGFRLSAGARYVDLQLKATALTGLSIGNNDYTAAQVGAVRATVSNSNKIAPYIGLGYDAAHFKGKGFNFAFGIDVGAMHIGKVDAKITTDKTVAGLQADIDKETKSLESKLDKYTSFYPVIMMSGRLTF
jgi:hypothetical protein